MTTQEMAVELTKAWIAQRGSLSIASQAATDISLVYKAMVKAINESYKEE